MGICRTGTLCSWRRTVWSERGGTATKLTIDFDVLPCVAQSYTAVKSCEHAVNPREGARSQGRGIHHGTSQGDAESPGYGVSPPFGGYGTPRGKPYLKAPCGKRNELVCCSCADGLPAEDLHSIPSARRAIDARQLNRKERVLGWPGLRVIFAHFDEFERQFRRFSSLCHFGLHISRASCAGVQNNGWLLLQGEASSGHGVDLCRRSSGEQRWRLLLLPQEGR